jgi:RNA 2',3'-cyclic 3'-phosphodiesterase
VTSIRAFVAVPLPGELVDALTALRDRIRPDLKASWTRPELMHLTLHFLGDVAPASIAGISTAIQTSCAKTPPFYVAARGLGVFPDPRRPRVLWAGIEDAGPLLELQRRLAAPLKRCGVELDSRSYRPHLTLARFREPLRRQPLTFLRTILLTEQRDFASVPVGEVRLHRSELLPGGPRYTVLSTAPLTRSP